MRRTLPIDIAEFLLIHRELKLIYHTGKLKVNVTQFCETLTVIPPPVLNSPEPQL